MDAKPNTSIAELLDRYPLISDQVSRREVEIILANLDRVLQDGVPGHVVEFGCYTGTTSLFLQRWIGEYSENRVLHAYDSFSGLPEKSEADKSPAGEQFTSGKLNATKSQFIKNFKKANLKLPYIHKGWFDELSENDVPSPIAFAFLDGDFYDSIHDSLRLIWPKLSPGSIVIVDDYASESLPGAKRAVDEWLRTHKHKHMHAEASLAIIELYK